MPAWTTAQLTASLRARRPVTGATLSHVDWQDLDAEDACFTECLIEHAQLAGSVLAGARFQRCRFVQCRFAQADLHDADFDACAFLPGPDPAAGRVAPAPAPPSACTFMLSDLRRARFTDCDLSLAVLERCELHGVAMERCILRGLRLHECDFSRAVSRRIRQGEATFRHCNLELASLARAELAGCDLSGSRLREADLEAADLTDATLRDCDLTGALLAGARLAGADMRGAELAGLDLMALGSFAGLRIEARQQHALLAMLGIEVHPDPA